MSLPQNLDPTNLAILKLILGKPGITTREIENVVFLSRMQVLRRLRQLEEQGMIVKTNGASGKAYHYSLSPTVTLLDIETDQANRDLVARAALSVVLQGLKAINTQLTSTIATLEKILR